MCTVYIATSFGIAVIGSLPLILLTLSTLWVSPKLSRKLCIKSLSIKPPYKFLWTTVATDTFSYVFVTERVNSENFIVQWSLRITDTLVHRPVAVIQGLCPLVGFFVLVASHSYVLCECACAENWPHLASYCTYLRVVLSV